MAKLADQRVAVLVDGQNLYLSAKARGAKPDYGKIMSAVNGRQVTRAIIYNICPEWVNQGRFVYAVESLGYEVKTKAPRPLPDGSFKADWDMAIAIDALALASKVDAMVIMTGDSDFVPLVHALKSKGVKVEIMSFRETTGRELIEVADKYSEISNEMLIVDHRAYVDSHQLPPSENSVDG